MRSTLFLRIASVLTFIHAVLHTVGGVFGSAASGVAQTVVTTMKAYQFPVMGVMRSYWDFHMGLGLMISIFLTIEAVVFWQLGTVAKAEARRLRPVLTTFFVGYLSAAVVSCLYFFAAPVITEVLIAACLGLAIWSSRQAATLQPLA
jgi:hypothetical protein